MIKKQAFIFCSTLRRSMIVQRYGCATLICSCTTPTGSCTTPDSGCTSPDSGCTTPLCGIAGCTSTYTHPDTRGRADIRWQLCDEDPRPAFALVKYVSAPLASFALAVLLPPFSFTHADWSHLSMTVAEVDLTTEAVRDISAKIQELEEQLQHLAAVKGAIYSQVYKLLFNSLYS
jgi:hypothetical protein